MMQLVVYWASAPGAHPNASIEMTLKCWPVMHRQVRKLGYKLIVLTHASEKLAVPHYLRIDYDIKPELCALAREQAWSRYVASLPEGVTAVMIEPDCYLLRRIPDLRPDADMLLLRRPNKMTPTCFRMAKRTATPYYAEMCRRVEALPADKHIWCGDMDAQQSMVGRPDNPPSEFQGVRIEHRDHADYTEPKRRANPSAIAWYFNGTKKRHMVNLR